MPRYSLSMKATLAMKDIFILQQSAHTLDKKRPHLSISHMGQMVDTNPYQPTYKHSLHGLSHKLHVISQHFTIEEWQDTRPQHVIQNHNLQAEQDINTSAAMRGPQGDQNRKLYTLYTAAVPTHRLRWYDPDDTGARWYHNLELSDQCQEYYYQLAIYHKMQTMSNRTGLTAYVSAALEAIGLHYLTPPNGYLRILNLNPNYKALIALERNAMLSGMPPRFVGAPEVIHSKLIQAATSDPITGCLTYMSKHVKIQEVTPEQITLPKPVDPKEYVLNLPTSQRCKHGNARCLNLAHYTQGV